MRHVIFFFAAIGWLFISLRLDAADIFLGTSKFRAEKITIGIVPFSVPSPQETGETGRRSSKTDLPSVTESIFKEDIARSQRFKQIDFIDDKGQDIDLTNAPDKKMIAWAKRSGVLAIIWAKLYPSSDKWVMEAYAYDGSNGNSVIRVKMTGTDLRALAHRFSDKLVYQFTGESGIAQTKIVYRSNRAGGPGVYFMDYDGQNIQQVTVNSSVFFPPRWSFDAAQIGYTEYRHGMSDIYLVQLATGLKKKIFSSKGLSFAPVWSPGGEAVAFSSTKEGNADLYTMRPDGSELKRLTSHRAADLSPTWSPTGRDIAFTSDRGGSPQIYLMDADGGNVRRLTYSGGYNTSAAWSPQGDWIAYACRNGKGLLKLCAERVNGEGRAEVTVEGNWDDESPSWSPNGREIVFTSNRTGENQIFVIRPDRTGLLQLTTDKGDNTSPAWAPR